MTANVCYLCRKAVCECDDDTCPFCKQWTCICSVPERGATVILNCTKEYKDVESVEFINISEDMQGKDVMTYVCPECGDDHQSHVYG
jgi:hypothetical protein